MAIIIRNMINMTPVEATTDVIICGYFFTSSSVA